MKSDFFKMRRYCTSLFIGLSISIFCTPNSFAASKNGEALYKHLLAIAHGNGDASLFETLNAESRGLDWSKAEKKAFDGNLRLIKAQTPANVSDRQGVFLIRELSGEIFILSIPEDRDHKYADLEKATENRMEFEVDVLKHIINGKEYTFAKFIEKPRQHTFDKVFKISIILMLFFVMLGMGMTLTTKDFALVFSKPLGIFIGEILQFGFMPLFASAIGHVFGFYDNYPYIFVGMILITAIPGGVISNLMTHFAKGDLALSISLTSLSTVLSLLFTPLLLALYCVNVPEITIPVKLVIQTITVLVIVPLIIGMIIRAKWERFAKKSTGFFSALGIITLLFIMIAGVAGNLDKFADTERYNLSLYSVVFLLTIMGMFVGAVVPKLLRVSNYQCRAISLESGLRNSTLAMTIAILIQDQMGDFYSSMFAVSGIFGLEMFVSGLISIVLYKKLLPT